jgi:alpha-D-ribose 1-methylphosphonate 5-triphosphate synthase subunit PhnH
MYQPYPGSDTRLPETQRPPAPASVRTRITGTVLLALATVDTLVGLTTPIAAVVRIWAVVTGLAGLAAVVFLWRRDSSAYLRPRA